MTSVVAIGLAVLSVVRADPPLLRVLTDTGEKHNGLPVVTQAADARRYEDVLLRGFSGTLVRAYLHEQRLTHPERLPRPAYLVLTDNQGGFPRSGFELDGRPEHDAAFVDLHRRSTLTGRHGAIDQIFPHELMHIIVKDLAGEPRAGFASQVHAIGVQTDRSTAFNEGLAESAQILAIDDPDAAPETRLLASDARRYADARARFDAYAAALRKRWNVGTRARMTFPFWFSQSEQVVRYHAVRENVFSCAIDMSSLATPRHLSYDAYLLENVALPPATAATRSAARMIATEGVVAALFWRLLASPACRDSDAGDEVYGAFGTARPAVDSQANVLLKLFVAVREAGHDASRVIRAYRRLFPAEAAAVDAIVRDVFRDQSLPDGDELWLRNRAFRNGRSLFDQFRAMPVEHTFDLNAASRLDLIAVPGVGNDLASRILARIPVRSLDDLSGVQGMTAEVLSTLRGMQAAMLGGDRAEEDGTGSLTIAAIMTPYARRAAALLGIASVLAAVLYRLARRAAWWRVALNGLAAGLSGLGIGWTIDPGTGVLALAVPFALFGLPAMLTRLWRTRSLREALTVAGAWLLASLVPAMIVRPA